LLRGNKARLIGNRHFWDAEKREWVQNIPLDTGNGRSEKTRREPVSLKRWEYEKLAAEVIDTTFE